MQVRVIGVQLTCEPQKVYHHLLHLYSSLQAVGSAKKCEIRYKQKGSIRKQGEPKHQNRHPVANINHLLSLIPTAKHLRCTKKCYQ